MENDTIAALEALGFTKALTHEEWVAHNEQLAASDKYGSTDLTIEYILEREDGVRVTIEQNTQTDAPFGVLTTVRYPDVAVVEYEMKRVACTPQADLITAMANQLRYGPGYLTRTEDADERLQGR